MLPEKLKKAILATGTEREWLLYAAGIEGLYHLGEMDVWGLHLIDATPEDVLKFVRSSSY